MLVMLASHLLNGRCYGGTRQQCESTFMREMRGELRSHFQGRAGQGRARFQLLYTLLGPSRPSSPLPRRRLAIPAQSSTVAPVARRWLVRDVVMALALRSLGTVAAASNQTFIIERALLSFTPVARCRSRRHAGTRAVKSPTQPTHILTLSTSTVYLAGNAPSLSVWSFHQLRYPGLRSTPDPLTCIRAVGYDTRHGGAAAMGPDQGHFHVRADQSRFGTQRPLG